MTGKNFAIIAHGEQERKYTGEPYWYHLEEVAHLVAPLGGIAICTAWLHDTLEDTSNTYYNIRLVFGDVVALNVLSLSDLLTPRDGNRKFRKDKYRETLSECDSTIQSVKVADLISNSVSIKKYDPDFAKVYLQEKKELLEVLTKADKVLLRIAWGLL